MSPPDRLGTLPDMVGGVRCRNACCLRAYRSQVPTLLGAPTPVRVTHPGRALRPRAGGAPPHSRPPLLPIPIPLLPGCLLGQLLQAAVHIIIVLCRLL